MEIDDEEILQGLAAGGTVDYSLWPALLPRLIERVEKIAHEQFPIPNLPPPPPPPLPLSSAATVPSSVPRVPDADSPEHLLAPLPSSPTEPRLSSPSLDADKENDPVPPQASSSPPPLPPPTSAPSTSATLSSGTLPPQLALMLHEITSYLGTTFPTYPPHTIQRISELVIHPKQHYCSLATYLHALDRVVHVTSGLNVYPLPLAHAGASGSLANGVLEAPSRPSPWASPGSDEALGGALLTPIPWISLNQRPAAASIAQQAQASQAQQGQAAASSQEVSAELEGEVRTESTERIDGPNGVGSVETVSVSVNGIPSMGARGVSVTQGELLRQEQEAGLVPVSQLIPSHHIQLGSSAGAAAAQQQIQARIQQRRAEAQSQNPARTSSAESPDSSGSASNTVPTPSSTTLEGTSVSAAADNVLGATEPIQGGDADVDEKPHARGPEEIGADDLGPQFTTLSTLPITIASGGMRQGIDIQAAVGRKPLDASAASTSEELPKGDANEDKMDVDKGSPGVQLSSPKRDAEDQVGSPASKKLKDDSKSDPGDEGLKPAEAESKNEEDNDGDAMDKD